MTPPLDLAALERLAARLDVDPWVVGAWYGTCHVEHRHAYGLCRYDYSLKADTDYTRSQVSRAKNPVEIVGTTDDGPILTPSIAADMVAARAVLPALLRIARAATVVAADFSGTVGQPASLFALRAALEGREG